VSSPSPRITGGDIRGSAGPVPCVTVDDARGDDLSASPRGDTR